MARIAKVPVIMQMEAVECGAASLCMILAYHGKWLPLEQVRADCGVSRDGCSAKNLVKAGRAYGLEVMGLRMEPAGLREIEFPAIIHWNFNHFVVLNGFKKDKAVLNDPARGIIEVSTEEFDRSFTGIVLRFRKTESFVPGGKPRSVWEFAKKRLKGTASDFVYVMLTGMLIAATGMITPLFSRIFLDNILSGKNPEWLMPFLSAMAITLVFQFIIRAMETVHWHKLEGQLAIKSNASFMWHVLRLPMEFFSQRFAGDIASIQSSNEAIASTLLRKLAPVLMNTVLLVFYLVIMLGYSVPLTIVGITAVVINIVVLRIVSKKRVNMSRVLQRDGGKLSGITMSGFDMIETIKASGAEGGFFERWAGYFARQSNAQVQFTKANQVYDAIPPLLQQIANIGVLMIGVYLILDGEFTIGMLLAFQGFLSSFLSPVNELVSAGQSMVDMRSQMERVEDVINYEPDVSGETELETMVLQGREKAVSQEEPVKSKKRPIFNTKAILRHRKAAQGEDSAIKDERLVLEEAAATAETLNSLKPDTQQAAEDETGVQAVITSMAGWQTTSDGFRLEKLSGKIDLNAVTFGYNKLSPPLIESFSLSLKSGGSVAFVGGSGSGKSTLAKLISGLYRPWSGEIRFDGQLRNEISRNIFTGSLAVVDQDIILFEDTILNNITMWDKSIDEGAVIAACKDAQIHEDILQREGGYSHVIREGGANFSGGQRQRFEIARALAQEPSIMILDEATSALDAKTELLVMEAIKARGITLIIVAHRLSTIRDCDEIIVLNNGIVEERGRHEELNQAGGRYARLISN